MKYIWRIFNSCLVGLGFYAGYACMSPGRLAKSNPDAIFCLLILVLTPVVPLWSVYYLVRSGKCQAVRRPTWGRNPLNWWYDPLQSSFVSTCLMSAAAIGSAFRLPGSGAVGFWTFAAYCCCAVGLAVGQLIVYKVYRQRITDA
jgi:hypothetical protein